VHGFRLKAHGIWRFDILTICRLPAVICLRRSVPSELKNFFASPQKKIGIFDKRNTP